MNIKRTKKIIEFFEDFSFLKINVKNTWIFKVVILHCERNKRRFQTLINEKLTISFKENKKIKNMKIKEISFIHTEGMKQMDKYLNMEVLEFVERIELKKKRGKHVKRDCLGIYNLLYDNIERIPDLGGVESDTILSEAEIKQVKPVSVRSFVKEYAEQNKEFHYSDLVNALNETDIDSTNSNIRQYILSFCRVDRNDNQHFCLKDCTEEFTQYDWRNNGTNAIYPLPERCSDTLSSETISDEVPIESGSARKRIQRSAKEALSNHNSMKTSFGTNPIEEESRSYSYIDWNQLGMILKQDLTYYNQWMNKEGVDFEKAIEKFISFMRSASNTNLNMMMPRRLYKYYFGYMAREDKMELENLLSIGYEGVLEEISFANTGEKVKKNSLGNWICDEYTEFLPAINDDYSSLQGFLQVMFRLYKGRNIFSHGGFVQNCCCTNAKNISDYIALYIHTVAKYAA